MAANTVYVLYTVLAVIFLHIISLPIVFGATVYVSSDDDFGELKVKLFFLTVFKRTLDVRGIKDKLEGIAVSARDDGGSKSNDDKSDMSEKSKKFSLRLAVDTFSRVRMRELGLNTKFGTGDAAVSAFIVGMLRILYAQGCAFFGIKDKPADIAPVYDAECIFIDFSSIFSLCFADIIYALVVTAIAVLRPRKAPMRRIYANTAAE